MSEQEKPSAHQQTQQKSSNSDDRPLEPVQTDYRGCLWIKWHIYMAIGSIYIAMMVTNWNTPRADDHLK